MTATERQTELCDRVREFLQSIAIQAVQAQDQIGSDKCTDTIDSISEDVRRVVKMHYELMNLRFPEGT